MADNDDTREAMGESGSTGGKADAVGGASAADEMCTAGEPGAVDGIGATDGEVPVGFWKSLRYGKGFSFILIVLVTFGSALAVFHAAGKPPIPLWMFWSSTTIFIAVSILLTKATRRIKGYAGYLMDVVYSVFLGLSFITAMEIERPSIWYSALHFLWILVAAICISTYLDKRHPKAPQQPEPMPVAQSV